MADRKQQATLIQRFQSEESKTRDISQFHHAIWSTTHVVRGGAAPKKADFPRHVLARRLALIESTAMAALMRHGVFKTVQIRPTTNGFATKSRKNSDYDKKRPPKIDSTAQSIAAKGFLRPQNTYIPPPDVDAKLDDVFQKVLGTTSAETSVGNLTQKFQLCTACAKELDHPIPNSLLHTMETLDDVKKFYQTPVDTITPLDRMRNMELPQNLHVQFEYHRFHPDTDTKFKGQTAFNRSSTLVTGLKYKGKYKGHLQNQEWPFNS